MRFNSGDKYFYSKELMMQSQKHEHLEMIDTIFNSGDRLWRRYVYVRM